MHCGTSKKAAASEQLQTHSLKAKLQVERQDAQDHAPAALP